MLQRFIFSQKQHLEHNLSKFQRKLAIGLSYRARHASAQSSLQIPSVQNHAGSHTTFLPPHSVDNLTSWAADTTPFPEFAPVIDAFACNDPLDSIIRCVKSSPSLLSFFQDPKKIRDVVANLAQSTAPHRSIDILQLAHKVGHTLKHGAYEAVAYHLASNKNWDLVLISASLGSKHVGKPTARLLNWRARALLELQQYGLLQDLLRDFDSAKLSPTNRTYQIVLTGCLQNHDMEGAKQCIRRMQETGSFQTPQTLSLIGRFHRHFGVDRKVRQNILDTLPDLSPSFAVIVLNNTIQSALDMGDVSTTLDLLTLFKQSCVEDIISGLQATHDPMAQILPGVQLPDIPGGFKPDTRTFAITMNYHIRRSNFQRAINLGEAALLKGLPATEDVITSFVHAFFLQNRGNIAVEMIARISTKPMPIEFGVLLARTAPKVDQHAIPNISNVPLTIRICNALLRGTLRRQGLRHVPTIFAIMHGNNLQPNARTLEILVSHMSSSEGVRPRTILKILQDLSASAFEVSLRHLHHLIRYILREEKRSCFGTGWRSYAKKYRGLNRKLNLPSRSLGSSDQFDPLGGINFGSHTGYGNAAESLLQSLVERKVKSDPAMISMRIRLDALLHGETESAQDVFRTLSARGMHTTHYHFSALMEGYSMMGDLDAAKEVMELARNAGVSPNVVMYTILIHGYGRKHDPSSAMHVFREMVEQGIYPDVASINAVVGAFFASGTSKTARRHLIMLWPYIEPFPETLQHASLLTLLTHFRSLDLSRSKTKRSRKANASIYHQLRRLLASYQRYFGPTCAAT